METKTQYNRIDRSVIINGVDIGEVVADPFSKEWQQVNHEWGNSYPHVEIKIERIDLLERKMRIKTIHKQAPAYNRLARLIEVRNKDGHLALTIGTEDCGWGSNKAHWLLRWMQVKSIS